MLEVEWAQLPNEAEVSNIQSVVTAVWLAVLQCCSVLEVCDCSLSLIQCQRASATMSI